MKRRLKCFICLVLFLGVALSGCADAPEETSRAAGKTFVMGDTTFNAENGEADINPHHDSGGWACIRYGVGETLFRFTDEMQIQPWLAESAENLDAHTWRITLREGIRFTSGRTLDAQAVKECLEALVETHMRAQGDLRIQEMEAHDQTLIIRTETAVPALTNFLADPYACIIDMQAGVTPDGIVQGTGPYKAVQLETDKRLELEKNSDYWNGTPKLDHITIRTISDGDTLTMALRAGEIDAAYGMPYASYPLFDEDDYTFHSASGGRVFFAAMNFQSSITKDSAVRKAIAMGVDKEGFVRALLMGNGEAAEGPFPAEFSFGGGSVAAKPYDPEGAKALLEAAGWHDSDGNGVREKDGQKLTLRWLTYPSRQELPLLAEAAQIGLRDIGFDVEIISSADHTRLRQDLTAWDIYVSAAVSAPTGDAAYFFSAYCLEDAQTNVGAYRSDALQTLAAQMQETFDSEERAALAKHAQQIILDDDAFVFFAHLRMNIITKSNVVGLAAHPCDYYEITADLDVR